MIALKVARLSENTKKKDSWVDVVGYGALGGEMVSRIEAEAEEQIKIDNYLKTQMGHIDDSQA